MPLGACASGDPCVASAVSAAGFTRFQRRGVQVGDRCLSDAAAVLGASGRLQAVWRSTLSKRPVDSTAAAACPGGATLWRDAGSREVVLPTRADRCLAGWIQQPGARGENAGGSPLGK